MKSKNTRQIFKLRTLALFLSFERVACVCATNLKRRINASHPRTYLSERANAEKQKGILRAVQTLARFLHTAQLLCK